MTLIILQSLLCGLIFIGFASCKVTPDVYCGDNVMDIRVAKEGVDKVLLEKWDSIPGCQPKHERDAYLISLKLSSELDCGLTMIRNKITNNILYYHKLVITEQGGRKHLFKVSCFMSPHDSFMSSNIVKRNVFPPEFVEPDYIEIVTEVSGSAPIPELSVGVRQNGALIGNQVTVSPGAPLTMEVYLDSKSSATYGILMSYMMVTDNTDKNETIIFNGCTQDRYVFENFQTDDGDYLTAKFRAFKFPESNYLLFRGTVDVCLDRCQGIRCSSGEIGYGRKKRALPQSQADPNKIFEVSMMTFLKFDNEEVDAGKAVFLTPQDIRQNPHELHRQEEEIYVKESVVDDPSPSFPFLFYGAQSHASSVTPQNLICHPISLLFLVHRLVMLLMH